MENAIDILLHKTKRRRKRRERRAHKSDKRTKERVNGGLGEEMMENENSCWISILLHICPKFLLVRKKVKRIILLSFSHLNV